MVPWGINDYFAPLFVSLERSIENVLRMARRSQAHVLTANILPETYEEGENVWHSVLLKIGKPIPISNEAGVAEVITELYPK